MLLKRIALGIAALSLVGTLMGCGKSDEPILERDDHYSGAIVFTHRGEDLPKEKITEKLCDHGLKQKFPIFMLLTG